MGIVRGKERKKIKKRKREENGEKESGARNESGSNRTVAAETIKSYLSYCYLRSNSLPSRVAKRAYENGSVSTGNIYLMIGFQCSCTISISLSLSPSW